MPPALLKRKEVFKVRLFLYFVTVIIIISATITGCKKDTIVVPAKNQIIKLETTKADSTSLSGGNDDPKHPSL